VGGSGQHTDGPRGVVARARSSRWGVSWGRVEISARMVAAAVIAGAARRAGGLLNGLQADRAGDGEFRGGGEGDITRVYRQLVQTRFDGKGLKSAQFRASMGETLPREACRTKVSTLVR
jgi:hypothetical protein